MNEFLEYEESKKSIKSLNLDDFSVEDLDKYTLELKDEIDRVNMEKVKKKKLISEAENIFK
ncbi:DUF1192 family protein [Alphaproteobacteria bacterium]|nr:DUF1192 family protein [Alphaproteobacteria bacterium]MDC3270444.1 DUF1192 family protein [Alphaproteobacteria bacterium]